MSYLEQDLEDLLVASTGVTTLVGSGSAARIYPVLLPQNATLPAITYQVISEDRRPELTRQNGLYEARVQITCWATTYLGARALKEAVRNCIDGSTSTFTSGVFIENSMDTIEESEGARPGRLYGKRIDAMFWVLEDYATFA